MNYYHDPWSEFIFLFQLCIAMICSMHMCLCLCVICLILFSLSHHNLTSSWDPEKRLRALCTHESCLTYCGRWRVGWWDLRDGGVEQYKWWNNFTALAAVQHASILQLFSIPTAVALYFALHLLLSPTVNNLLFSFLSSRSCWRREANKVILLSVAVSYKQIADSNMDTYCTVYTQLWGLTIPNAMQ